MLSHMTKREPKPTPTPDEQHARFVEMARTVGADESEGALDRAFEKVIRPKVTGNPTQTR
jgi:hypothetical protein